MKIRLHLFFILFFIDYSLQAQEQPIPFSDTHWDLSNAQLTKYLGRQSVSGTAILKNVVFEDGTILFDIAISDVRRRSYPGIEFRVRENGMSEHLYIRPHRAPIYPDALQYTPKFNGESCWQFCNGPGYTNQIIVPAEKWNQLKIEVSGKQARVYWNDMDKPALVIPNLMHGTSKGGIILSRGPGEAPLYFSNFRYRPDNNLAFDPSPEIETPENTLANWEISRGYPAGNIRLSEMKYPRFFQIAAAQWEHVEADGSGLVNISKIRKRSEDQPDLIFARTIFQSEEKKDIRLDFGYSDEVLIFLNGKPVFHGISYYTRRDPSFLGIIGYHDDIHLTVEKGRNEIFLILREWFGGWGFMAKTDQPLNAPKKDHTRLTRAWEADNDLTVPESVIYDQEHEVLYVTNFNPRFQKNAKEESYKGYISKLGLDGNLIEKKWVFPLHAPTGMAIHKDKLYTLERRNLTEIELKSGKILQRYPIPDVDFPNDLAIDKKGAIYISDTAPVDWTKGKIYRFYKGQFEVWLEGYDIWRPNAMFIHNGKLLFGGAAGDPFFKAVDLETKHMERIGSLGAGTIDGFRVDKNGNYLVSHWEGQIYSVTPSGEVTELIDSDFLFNTADFEYIAERNLLIIPTFFTNKIIAYKIE